MKISTDDERHEMQNCWCFIDQRLDL